MDELELAKTIAKNLENLDSIAKTNVINDNGGTTIQGTTQGGTKFSVSVHIEERIDNG